MGGRFGGSKRGVSRGSRGDKNVHFGHPPRTPPPRARGPRARGGRGGSPGGSPGGPGGDPPDMGYRAILGVSGVYSENGQMRRTISRGNGGIGLYRGIGGVPPYNPPKWHLSHLTQKKGGEKKVSHLSRLGELLNTQRNVHPGVSRGPPGGVPGTRL